jgi:hypothetical protein
LRYFAGVASGSPLRTMYTAKTLAPPAPLLASWMAPEAIW